MIPLKQCCTTLMGKSCGFRLSILEEQVKTCASRHETGPFWRYLFLCMQYFSVVANLRNLSRSVSRKILGFPVLNSSKIPCHHETMVLPFPSSFPSWKWQRLQVHFPLRTESNELVWRIGCFSTGQPFHLCFPRIKMTVWNMNFYEFPG